MSKYTGYLLFLIVFLSLQDLFNPYRNDLCDTYLNSLLDSRNHTIEIIKKLLLTVLCVYIANYLYKQMKIAFDNGYSLLKSIFIDLFKAEVDIKLCFIPSCLNCNQNTSKELRIYRNLKIFLIIFYFGITLLKLIFVNYINLIHLWAGTYLLINFLILSIVLLLQFFPYQIFISLSSYLQYEHVSTNENGTKSCNRNNNIYRLNNTGSVSNTTDVADEEIDNAFIECKLELRDKYFQDADYKDASNQPNMRTAYKILFIYIFFAVFSVLNSLLFNHLEDSFVKMSKTTFFIIVMLIILLIASKTILALLMNHQPRESQYVKYLKQKIVFVPFLPLVLSFLNVYFFLKISKLALTTLFIEFLLIMFLLFIFMQIVRFVNRKSLLIATDMLAVNETENNRINSNINEINNNGLKSTSSKIDLIGSV